MMPPWLEAEDDGVVLVDCTLDEWMEAFVSGFFCEWYQKKSSESVIQRCQRDDRYG